MKEIRNVLYLMGVSGSGKTTIGKLLAQRLGIPFFDGDDYHPKANVKKMTEGHPLSDEDRQGWLQRLNQLAKTNRDIGAVIACSALKGKYREILQDGIEHRSQFVFLKGSFEEVSRRLQQRKGHFMPSELLRSQFATLETPEDAISVSIQNTPNEIVSQIISRVNV